MIFVKFPEPGKVKTRLAKILGNEGAAGAYRKLVARVAENVVPSGKGRELWAIWVVFDPAERETEMREWIEPLFAGAEVDFVPQVRGDLGERMAAAFATGLARGYDQVAAIGSDCADLSRGEITECWHQLGENDVVFGPADDGGYYLVGMKAPCRAGSPDVIDVLFNEVPWSDERTLEVSMQRAVASGLRVAELPALSDVDEIEQWNALCAEDPSWLDGVG